MKKIFFTILCLISLSGYSQGSRLGEDVDWSVTLQGAAGSGDVSPFWFTSNRFGLGMSEQYSGLSRVSLIRNVEADSLRFWGVGYGADVAGVYGKGINRFVVQQAFLDIQWKMLRLSLGQKERASELKNRELSTGGLILGNNARPLPQVRAEMPDFWAVPGTHGLFSFKGHIAYGLYTDNKWQRDFVSGTENLCSQDSWFHSKALFVKIGNSERFPLEFTLGAEMACQFKGMGYNVHDYGGLYMGNVSLGGNVFTALIPGTGSDVNDFAGFANSAGNQLGSYHFRLDWKQDDWSLGAYMEHMYEDQSQMFMQYGFWKDMLLGVEVNLPKNPVLTTALFEYNGTMNQTGPIYHDRTPENSMQISAGDSYYFNHVYGSWQHAGYVMGNPTILSPLYNKHIGTSCSLVPLHNRIKVFHVGLSGNPTSEIHWNAKYTHMRSLGTYGMPLMSPQSGNFIYLEAKYTPTLLKGLGFALSYGHNDGSILGRSDAGMLTVSWNGRIRSTQ